MFKSLRRFKNVLSSELKRSDLLGLLTRLDPHNKIEERIQALKEIMEWIRLPTKTAEDSSFPPNLQARNIRFRFLLQFIERNPQEGTYFIETLRELLDRGTAIRLYCLTGVSENNGFFSDLTDRAMQSFLPHILGERDLAELFKAIFTEIEDAEWFESCYKVIIPPLMDLITKHSISTTGLVNDQEEALIILGAQISSLGISRSIRRRLDNHKLSDSSFIRLSTAINREGLAHNKILQEVSHCRVNLQKVRKNVEAAGVSVDLIYNLEKLHAMLERVEMMIYLREIQDPDTKTVIVAQFIGRLIRDEIRSTSIKDFLFEHLQMLTKKVVERAGEKGDHYIANTPEERRSLWVAASWAGVLTAFTAVIKINIGFLSLPLFIQGFFYFLNYAVGFLLMQRWHLVLSSKPPAFTASALSRKFEVFLQTKELNPVISEVKKVSHSQFITTIANLLWVMPIVIILDWCWFFVSNEHIINNLVARDILEKHHPLRSGTIPYAMLTGILLWLSSVVSGWVENWMVFRNVTQMIKENSFLGSYLGKEKSEKLSRRFPSIMGAMAGNISIAFFLATPIIISKLTGMPLDIRHVTLATGTITLAFNSLGWDLSLWPWMVWMLISIGCMGLLNFGVSFYCAIRMAALARDVKSKYLKIIFKFSLRGARKEAD
jgi:site-specific recombinase